MKRFYYLLTMSFVFILPSLAAGWVLREEIELNQLLVFVLLVTCMGSVWDIWATRHGTRDTVWLWNFNYSATLGYTFFDLPIEEYVFYTSSSVYVVLMWELIKRALLLGTYTALGLVLMLTLWTVLAITLPFFIRPKRDRLAR